MAGNHDADATTQPCVGVKGIGQGRSKTSGFAVFNSILDQYFKI